MFEPIIWLLLIELIGLAALPLSLSVFQFLPERGYTLAKPLGLLVVAYAVWLLSMLGLPFNSVLSWAVLGVLAIVINAGLLWRQKGRLRQELAEFVSNHVWLIVVAEILFVLAYAYLVNLRSFMPDIRDQEKFGDFAFLQSLTLNTQMPPNDPWMSGYPINYYYFSHFMMAMLTKMSGIDPAISFNLTIPLVFAMTALGAFGLVYNLVRTARKNSTTNVGTPIAFGLLGFLMVAILGNLDTVRQIFFPRAKEYETGIENFVFSWWTPSRVIYDWMPIPGSGGLAHEWVQTINEFPMFSFLLADMHPHVMTLPTALLTIGLAFNLLQAHTRQNYWLIFSITALAIGALYFLNTWDYPTYLLLVGLAALVRELVYGRLETTDQTRTLPNELVRTALLGQPISTSSRLSLGWGQTIRWVGLIVRLVVVSLVFYLPFHLNFVSLVGDNPVPEPLGSIPIIGSLGRIISFVAWDRTPLLGYLFVFGIFVFPILSFLTLKLWPHFRYPYAYLNDQKDEIEEESNTGYMVLAAGLVLLLGSELGFFGLGLNPLITIGLAVIALPTICVALAILGPYLLQKWRNENRALNLVATTLGLMVLLVAGGWYLHFELYGPLVIVGVLSTLLIWFESKPQANETRQPLLTADHFGLLLILLPSLITFGTELILIRDVFNSRLNTLFKFYYQAWILFALAAAYASWRIIAWAWQAAPFESEKDKEAIIIKPQTTKRRVVRPLQAMGNANVSFFGAGVLSSAYEYDEEAYEAEEYEIERGRKPAWRWLWVLALGILVASGLIYPIFGPYEKTGHYTNRVGLDGSVWLRDGGRTGGALAEDYKAIQWLKSRRAVDPNFNGTILEASGPDWVDYSRISTFAGLPTVMGWVGHENQWRGGKAPARPDTFDCGKLLAQYNLRPAQENVSWQKDEPGCRLQMINTIYSTDNVSLARDLLQAAKISYVYIGSLETGLNNGRWAEGKGFSPESLLKFAQFMKVIYQDEGVTIYSF